VEPNIETHPTFTITSVDPACEQADLIVYLVKHKAFIGLIDLKGVVLDFCGVGE
jgi:UDP-N-acetyl-D-mannosaminuronic acid dehydrogenase